jgi:hypothetical protein
LPLLGTALPAPRASGAAARVNRSTHEGCNGTAAAGAPFSFVSARHNRIIAALFGLWFGIAPRRQQLQRAVGFAGNPDAATRDGSAHCGAMQGCREMRHYAPRKLRETDLTQLDHCNRLPARVSGLCPAARQTRGDPGRARPTAECQGEPLHGLCAVARSHSSGQAALHLSQPERSVLQRCHARSSASTY